MRNLWDWGFLDDCFDGTKIRLSDIDGYVERNGHFLFVEAKSPGKPIPRGQQLSFSALNNAGHTVMVIWGERNQPEQMQIWHRTRGVTAARAASIETIKEYVRNWFEWASRQIPTIAKHDLTRVAPPPEKHPERKPDTLNGRGSRLQSGRPSRRPLDSPGDREGTGEDGSFVNAEPRAHQTFRSQS